MTTPEGIDLARNGNSGCAHEILGCAKCHFWWKSPWKWKNWCDFRVCTWHNCPCKTRVHGWLANTMPEGLALNGPSVYFHYSGVIMSMMVSQITSVLIVYSTICSGADNRKHQSSASLAFVRGIHRWPVNSPHKGPVTQKLFPFDDIIMLWVVMMITISVIKGDKMPIQYCTCS